MRVHAMQASGVSSVQRNATAVSIPHVMWFRASVTAILDGTDVPVMPSVFATALPVSSLQAAANVESVFGALSVSACASVFTDAATRRMAPAPADQAFGEGSAESHVQLGSMGRTVATGVCCSNSGQSVVYLKSFHYLNIKHLH